MMKNEIINDDVTETLSRLNKDVKSFTERDRLILSFVIFDIPKTYQKDILDAYDYFVINPDKFDGTTGAEEQWVTLYEPPSMRHDLDYQIYGGTYKGRLYSDLKFLELKKKYKTSTIWRNTQYYAVRWGGFFFQFLNFLKGNTKSVPNDKLVFVPKRTNTQLVIECLGIILIVPVAFFIVGALVMEIKHKLSLGWSLSLNWIKKVSKFAFKRLF